MTRTLVLTIGIFLLAQAPMLRLRGELDLAWAVMFTSGCCAGYVFALLISEIRRPGRVKR